MKNLTLGVPRTAVLPLLFAACAALTGCGGENKETTSGGTTTDQGGGGAGGTTANGGDGGATGGAGGTTTMTPPPNRKTLKGTATWTVTFDDTAKAAGATDCTYTRTYEAVEDQSAPWLCRDCETMFLADVVLSDGLDTCYSQVSSSAPFKQEWIGYGQGKWWRSPEGPTTEQGTATLDGMSIVTANQVPDLDAAVGGKMAFAVAGQFTLGEELGDPMNGFVPPATYACGWPKSDAPPYTGDWVLAKNAIVPDGLFHDACDETVRLHDFKGAYLVIDMSAIDCPPCQQMAEEEEAFVTDMAAKGIEVRVITLLAPSLTDIFGLTTKLKLQQWTNLHELKSAVLADRGWGIAEFEPAIGADQIGYPSWTVVRPDLTVVDFMTGYGGWSDMQTIIEADMQ